MDTSDLRDFDPRHSSGHFGTNEKILDTLALVPKCLKHFGTTNTFYDVKSYYVSIITLTFR